MEFLEGPPPREQCLRYYIDVYSTAQKWKLLFQARSMIDPKFYLTFYNDFLKSLSYYCSKTQFLQECTSCSLNAVDIPDATSFSPSKASIYTWYRERETLTNFAFATM